MKIRFLLLLGLFTGSLFFSSVVGASITIKEAGKQYLQDISPLNSTLGKFVNSASHWTNSTTDAQAENQASPLFKALRNFQNELLEQSWPSVAKSDIRTLYGAEAPLEADLLSLSGVTATSASSWESKFAADVTSISGDANLVRHDLKLPLNSG